MLEIGRLFGFMRVPVQNQKADSRSQGSTGAPLLEKGGGVDTVSFSTPASEKFEDVLAEFRQNVPDVTTTIEEKELAISYIDRLLACSDITPELKEYWTEKKTEIEQEIQAIKTMEDSAVEQGTEVYNFDAENIFAAEPTISPLMDYVDVCRQSIEAEITQVTKTIESLDKEIANIESKLTNWFNKTFFKRSLNNKLESAKRRKEEQQAKLNELNKELSRLDEAKESGGIGHEDVLVECAQKCRQEKEQEAAKLSEEIAKKDEEIAEIEKALTKWFYRTFFKKSFNRDLENLRSQKAELQVKLVAINSELAKIDSEIQKVNS